MASRAVWWVLRRELHGLMRAPILYVIGGVFLVVQGVAFAGLVGALSDPRRPAPLGALLEGQLAGTLLTWVLELVVLTLLGMRAIADDKRSGAWELLLTAQVGEGAAVVGKWLATVAVYALLWLPTLAYLAVVALARADDGGWDVAAIACGYAGAIAIGAALLAWAIAASAAMGSSLGAGALGFALLIGALLVGELPALWPTLAVDHPGLAAGLAAVSLREIAAGFARGEIAAASVVVVGGAAVVGLAVAIALACAGRRRRAEVRRRVAGAAALAVAVVALGVLAVRHPLRIDVSADHRNSLDPATDELLAGLPGVARLTIVRPTLAGIEPIYDEVARVARRMAEQAGGRGRLVVATADPATAPGGLAAVARAAGLQPGDLATGGAVIVELAGRQRVVDLLAIATIDRGPGGAPTVEQLAIEQALAGALAALAGAAPIAVCATTGHGELPLDVADAAGADWTAVAARLRGEGMTVESVALAPAVPRGCRVLIVAGPATPLAPAEALAVQSYVAAGGAVVVAAASRALGGSGVGRTGLESVLGAHGLGLPPAIAIDPSLAVRELPGALRVLDGYSADAIHRGFPRARATLWFQPRVVAVGRGAHALISATADSWGETDFATAPPTRGELDLAGPVVLAARGGPVLALGSAESLSTALLATGGSAADLWLARAIRSLAGAPEPSLAIAARAPAQVRLVLTDGERTAIVALCVAGIPLLWLVLGAGVVWWRRRARP